MAARKYPYTDVLGWSASRYDVFSLCRRRYFFQYYGKYDPEVPKALLERLKKLETVPLVRGRVVHEVVAKLLRRLQRSREEIDRERFAAWTRGDAEEAVRRTEFAEVYYGDAAAVTVDDVLPEVTGCLERLLDSTRFAWITTEAIDRAADWVIEPDDFGEARMDGRKVYMKVDAMFPVGGRYHVIDWKTGRADEAKYRRQLVGYVWWASEECGVSPLDVHATIAYLSPEYAEVHEPVDAAAVESFRTQVRAETDAMYEYCTDVERNVPRPKADFAPSPTGQSCAWCNFRGVCG